VVDLTGAGPGSDPLALMRAEAGRPFDLGAGPPLRVTAYH